LHCAIKLLDELDKLEKRFLYYDTDSIIFVTDQDRTVVLDDYYISKTGSFLGVLTNELQQDEFIIEFASGSPKNYAFLTNKNRSKTVVKGLSLNFENSQIVNYSSI